MGGVAEGGTARRSCLLIDGQPPDSSVDSTPEPAPRSPPRSLPPHPTPSRPRSRSISHRESRPKLSSSVPWGAREHICGWEEARRLLALPTADDGDGEHGPHALADASFLRGIIRTEAPIMINMSNGTNRIGHDWTNHRPPLSNQRMDRGGAASSPSATQQATSSSATPLHRPDSTRPHARSIPQRHIRNASRRRDRGGARGP